MSQTIAAPLSARRVVEFDASDLFDDDSNLSWCEANATFVHREACEYLLYLPSARPDRRFQLREMRSGGVSDELLAVVRQAHKRGADLLLLWKG